MGFSLKINPASLQNTKTQNSKIAKFELKNTVIRIPTLQLMDKYAKTILAEIEETKKERPSNMQK